MTHEDYQGLLAASALSALNAEDAREVDAHLEGCAVCGSELNEWEHTAAILALEANPVEPSPEVRARILTGIKSVGQLGNRSPDHIRAGSIKRENDSTVLPFEPRKNVFSSLGTLGTIAASLIFLALVISLIALWRENRSSQAELAKLSAQIQDTKAELALDREALELLSSPGARMQELAGTNVAPGAHAMVAYDQKGHAMLMAKALPAAPKGMAYQLWFIVGKKPMPGKVFTVDAAGNGTLEDQLPQPALGSPIFAITLEPESGMSSPTGAIYLSSKA
jgi:anti-sigma-K factor RskA